MDGAVSGMQKLEYICGRDRESKPDKTSGGNRKKKSRTCSTFRDLLQVKINSWLIYPFYCFLRIFRSFVFMILKRTFEECVSLFSYQRSVLHCRLSQTALLLYHVVSCLSRTFFNFFEVVFVSLLQQL